VHPEEVGLRAQGEHEVIEVEVQRDPAQVAGAVHPLRGQINRPHVGLDKLHSLEHPANGVHDVARVQVAGRYFVQHWREQQEVVAAHQRHFDVRAASECLVESKRRVHAAEAAA